MASFQLNLLFGQCNEYQRQADLHHNLKSLLDAPHKNSNFNERMNSYLNRNYESNENNNLDQASFKLSNRYKREIKLFSQECCDSRYGCSRKELKSFCPD